MLSTGAAAANAGTRGMARAMATIRHRRRATDMGGVTSEWEGARMLADPRPAVNTNANYFYFALLARAPPVEPTGRRAAIAVSTASRSGFGIAASTFTRS